MSTPVLSRNVRALAAVSLLSDVASEMIYPLLPLFLSGVLGASASAIGGIEGAAESMSAMLKLVSGWWSDRVRHRKPLVVAGYALATIARPLVAITTAPWQVLVVRLTDRAGKGIRTSPRDALLADSAEPADRGRAFGFLRAGDNMGAVIGPIIAWVLLQRTTVPLRSVFLWAAVPGVLSVLVLVAFVRERAAARTAPGASPGQAPAEAPLAPGVPAARAPARNAPFEPGFWRYLAVLFVFTLGNCTDAFLLLRASQLGVPTALVPIIWALFNLVRSLASTPGGALSDRVGRKPVIVAGWVVFATVYFCFGFATAAWQAWVLFAAYGVSLGVTEGVEKALVADLVPAIRRGTAYGWYNFVIGLGALPASVIFGVVWDRAGSTTAFTIGAGLAAVAALGLMVVVPRSARPV